MIDRAGGTGLGGPQVQPAAQVGVGAMGGEGDAAACQAAVCPLFDAVFPLVQPQLALLCQMMQAADAGVEGSTCRQIVDIQHRGLFGRFLH